jgi:hypothetical protein
MSLFRDLSPSIAALGFSAIILGAGLSCALSPAWAGGLSCQREIADLMDSANQPSDDGMLDGAAKPVTDAKDELVNEADDEVCLSQIDKAKNVLGL